VFSQASADRVLQHVFGCDAQVIVVSDHEGGVAVAEEMAAPTVSLVGG
jgi:hypothetical protein